MKNKKIIIICIIVIVIIAIFTIITITNKNKSSTTSFENNNAISNVVIDEIEFKDITKKYEEGITTINANVYNNTNKIKNINVRVILKDKNGDELKSLIQIIENIELGSKKIFSVSTLGNYINVTGIEFEVISNEELENL